MIAGDLSQHVLQIAQAAKVAAKKLNSATTAEKNKALMQMAEAMLAEKTNILRANQQDLAIAKTANLAPAFMDRLTLSEARIQAMAAGIYAIADLSDPVGRVLTTIERPNGLCIERVSVPIGVIAVIYESRPNVTADAAALTLKSGNAVILRGGSESFHSAKAILHALHLGLLQSHLPIESLQMVQTKDRAAIDILLQQDKWIDVIIPRGGPKLIEHLSKQSRIPLFKHLAGICHTYLHEAADLEKAKSIVVNAKMRRPGICGATETLLVDHTIYQTHLPSMIDLLLTAGCEVRGDALTASLNTKVKAAKAEDFDTEFLAPIIAIKVVKDIDEAISHIAAHGTQHTEAIITEDKSACEKFFREVDSAILMHNTSTQFADGGEFGMGAEIGIATGKLHARGPVGVEQLTTFKYLVRGNGQIRA